jgi:cellulose biosynthesis protein BcsQ
MKIEIYEPPMCCPTGVCGPNMDETLVKLMENIETLKKKYKDIEIQRYMITQYPQKFKENQEVFDLVKENGRGILPITTFNGTVVKFGSYLTLEEMEKVLGDE